MAKAKSVYSCTECGGQVLKWQGQCPHCQQWNTLVEAVAEVATTGNRFGLIAETGRLQRLSEVEAREESRVPTGITEFDRVLGGGLVAGAVVASTASTAGSRSHPGTWAARLTSAHFG
jgi:DNA repair protein RadA/Sms